MIISPIGIDSFKKIPIKLESILPNQFKLLSKTPKNKIVKKNFKGVVGMNGLNKRISPITSGKLKDNDYNHLKKYNKEPSSKIFQIIPRKNDFQQQIQKKKHQEIQ